MTNEVNWDAYPNFSRHEFECQCGCGQAPMDPEFLAKLQHARDLCGFRFAVSSGYRCPDHNDKVSSTGRDGPHTTGHAADIAVSYEKAHRVLSVATQFFPRIGVNQKGQGRFIHLDDLKTGSTVWSY